MSNTVKVVFETLNIKPNQKFHINKNEKKDFKRYTYYIDENLRLFAQIEGYDYLCDANSILRLIAGSWKIEPLHKF